MKSGVNLYDLLGISKDASLEAIREAYFEAARRYHPDVNPAPDANVRFAGIQRAYEILQDVQRRAEYDRGMSFVQNPTGTKINVSYSVKSIPKLDQPQLVYALANITCQASPESSRTLPLHVCLVLDCSTSMQGERLDLVKKNVALLVRRLRVQDILSVVAFNDRAEKLIVDARGAEHKAAENKISLLSASGGTEIFKGLDAGMALLRSTKDRATRLLVLVTDGYTYGDERLCIDLAKQARDDDVVFHAAGIGGEWNDTLLDQLAAITGGTTEFVTRSNDLFRFFEKQIDSLERLYARNIKLNGGADEGVELHAACRISPDPMILPLEYPMSLGPLLLGKTSTVLFEFMVHPAARHFKSLHLLDGEIKVDLTVKRSAEEIIHMVVRLPYGEADEVYEPSSELMDAVSRYNLYRLQGRARDEIAEGKIEQATKHLEQIGTHLLAQGETEMANVVFDEVRNIQKNQTFSDEGDKRLKYGTRRLMLPSGLEG